MEADNPFERTFWHWISKFKIYISFHQQFHFWESVLEKKPGMGRRRHTAVSYVLDGEDGNAEKRCTMGSWDQEDSSKLPRGKIRRRNREEERSEKKQVTRIWIMANSDIHFLGEKIEVWLYSSC